MDVTEIRIHLYIKTHKQKSEQNNTHEIGLGGDRNSNLNVQKQNSEIGRGGDLNSNSCFCFFFLNKKNTRKSGLDVTEIRIQIKEKTKSGLDVT